MKRRDFVAVVGSVITAWPLAARAQPTQPVIGVLSGNRFDEHELGAFRQGLAETGYAETRNVEIEYRSAEGQYDRLPELAADLLRHQVTVIVAIGGTVSAVAANAATASVPIVFSNGGDPIKAGLVPVSVDPAAILQA